MSFFYIYNSSFKKFKNCPPSLKLKKLPSDKNIVLISPHSDDIAVGCGGTVYKLSPFNNITSLLFFTGFRGVLGKNKARSIKIREKEMEQEARILGIKKPVFLHLKSYEKESKDALQKDILKVKKALKKYHPEIIFLPQKEDFQPRHRLATQIALQALNQSPSRRIQLFFYETVWGLFGALDFNTAFILSPQEMRKKIEAIRVHTSQLQRTVFDKAAKNLASFRALIVPEQRIRGYGGTLKNFAQYLVV